MKQFCKRSLALLLLLVMLAGCFSGITIRTQAAAYTYNWGTRGTLATELSDAAVAWYKKYNTSYKELSALSGSSSVGSVPSSALYSRLKSLMAGAHSYQTSYNATKNMYQYTDCQNGGGKISSFYSGTAIGPGWGEGGSWNREHTWPNSKGLGGSDEDDIMMLRPTSTAENSGRGNTAYGESGSYYDPNDESNGKYNLHGDVARIMLYVYVRWGNTSKMWGSSGVMESKEVLLKWMEEDPVDTWELGRNDAVQSITGTRNVFVDYPELAFDLFAADIPDNYDTPSGNSPSYTIVATSNNTAYGTVSMTGKTITATPKTGYQVAGYKVTSGSATVTRDGNTFTVTATSDCTIQIIFEARQKVTVTFIDQGKTVSVLTPYTGDTAAYAAYTGKAPDGFVFRGWVEQEIENSETKPAIYAEGASFLVTQAKTFYALYAKVEEGAAGDAAYHLVTDASQLSEGTSVVIAANTTSLAMKQTGGSSNRYAGGITKNADDTISFTEDARIDIFILGAGVNSGTYSFYSEANGQYLAAGTSSGSNILKLQSSVDAAASFTVSVSSDGTAVVTSQTSSDRNKIQYNSGANIFSCYSSGLKAISLYAQSTSGVAYYTTSPITCDHADTETVQAVAATCTEVGYTAGVFCNDCNRYISGHEELAATGHSHTLSDGIYICSGCGDSYDAVYVKFSVPTGVTKPEKLDCTHGSITLPSADAPQGSYAYTFVGWTQEIVEDTQTPPVIYKAGESYRAAVPVTLYALYTYSVSGENCGSGDYVKVTVAPEDWSGEYLIVYESSGYIFDGSLADLDAARNYKQVAVSDNTISAAQGDPYRFTVEKVGDGYSIRSLSGVYIGRTSTGNGLNESTTTAYTHTLSLDSSGNANIISSSGMHLKFNDASEQLRFRYYQSGQKSVQLYVKDGTSADVFYSSAATVCDHQWQLSADSYSATCEENGAAWYICIRCYEESERETIPALGHNYIDGICQLCGKEEPDDVPPVCGDVNGDGEVNNEDVEYLLWYTLFPEDYPITVNADYDANGVIDNCDVEFLLWHTLFPEEYPLFL